jgi:hypothetical protein
MQKEFWRHSHTGIKFDMLHDVHLPLTFHTSGRTRCNQDLSSLNTVITAKAESIISQKLEDPYKIAPRGRQRVHAFP